MAGYLAVAYWHALGVLLGALGAGVIGQLVGREIELTIAWLDAVAPLQLAWAAALGTGAAQRPYQRWWRWPGYASDRCGHQKHRRQRNAGG